MTSIHFSQIMTALAVTNNGYLTLLEHKNGKNEAQ